ncbi:MAG: hypothetical protein R3E93_00305 [Thiothrix sp.]
MPKTTSNTCLRHSLRLQAKTVSAWGWPSVSNWSQPWEASCNSTARHNKAAVFLHPAVQHRHDRYAAPAEVVADIRLLFAGLRILLVDDSHINLFIGQETKNMGAETVTASAVNRPSCYCNKCLTWY